MNNSNQTGIFLIGAILIAAIAYFFMFFGSEMENQNLSASFGVLSKTSSKNLFSNNNNTVVVDASITENRNELSGVVLPSPKMNGNAGHNYSQTSNPDFPTTGIQQMDVQNVNQSHVIFNTTHYAANQSNQYIIENNNVQYISNPENPTKSDINALLLLDTHAAQAAMSTQHGAKRATPSLAGKTATISSNLAGSKAVQKVDGNPNEPGGSLPVGDGVWIMLSMLGVYFLRNSRGTRRAF